MLHSGAARPVVPLSPLRRRVVTAGLLLGMLLGALEATVVSTAMPTVIARLGGLEHYSWVFSAYLLASTASVPVWGRLSDLRGRRRLYLIGIAIFLLGSALAGAAQSMIQLVAARAVQGLGAGAILPLAMTIVGEIYTLEERARMQAVFSGVWGVASILGPLAGGYITDALSWRWIFLLNIPFGLPAALLVVQALPESVPSRDQRVDWTGAVLLTLTIAAVLAGLSAGTGARWPWLAGAAVGLAALGASERRTAHPILPFALLARRVVAVSNLVVFLVGMAMFGAIAFVPLFVQGGLGRTATEAGRVLTPLFLGWVTASIVGARLMLRVGYRLTSMGGVLILALAFVALAVVPHDDWPLLLGVMAGLGTGMGFTMIALLLAVQRAVPRAELGLATSLNQFARSIGGAVGVAAMGAIVAAGVDAHAAGWGAHGTRAALALDPATREALV
ncbi:MAG TPA: MDR family MFS transporter, partial [Vicinamibacterales bacterium]|nr:MDR family MFS transporter [Vicinamibacterales bacterium]